MTPVERRRAATGGLLMGGSVACGAFLVVDALPAWLKPTGMGVAACLLVGLGGWLLCR